MKKKIIAVTNVIVSILIIAGLLYFVGIEDLLKEAVNINLFYLFLSILFLLLMDVAMSYRIKGLLEDMGEKLRLIDILKSHFIGMLAADFTPARAGYFATAAAMRIKYGIPSEKAMLSVFGPQIFDFAVKVVAGTAAVFYIVVYFLGVEDGWLLFAGSVVMGAIIATMLLMLFSKRFVKLFSFLERIPVASKLYSITVRMQDNSKTVIRKLPFIAKMIAFSWTFKSLSWYFAAKAVGINLDLGYYEILFYFFLQPLITMLEFIPSTTIAGLGLSEGASVLVFSFFGIGPVTAMLFALLVRFKTTFVHLPAVPEALKIYPIR